MKRVLSIALITALIVSMMPMMGISSDNHDTGSVYAETALSGKCGDNLTWQLIEDPRYPNYYTYDPDDYYYTLVISGTGDMYDYAREDNPHPWPFYDSDDLSIPQINDIVIEDGVTSIGDYAFYKCSSYDTGTNRYPTIEIPKSVTRIGTLACCSFCAKKINIPNSVTELGSYAFFNCINLEAINIPNSISVISDGAFNSCYRLCEIGLHNEITEIGCEAFEDCKKLEKISIPNSVRNIGFSAFRGCNSLISVSLPAELESIESGTFEYCSSIPSIEIPETVTSIEQRAFSACTSLSSISIPKGVATIEEETFYNCAALKSIYIPNSVTSIKSRNFDKCTELNDVYYAGNEAQWESIAIEKYNDFLLSATLHCEETGNTNAFKTGDKIIDAEFGYHYSDSYFSRSATKYDHSLATMSLCLAFSAYGDIDSSYYYYDKNVKAVLKGCGFTGPYYERYKQYSFNEKPTSDSIGCAMGSKKLSDGTTLIAVAVRGGGYESEWSSNLDVGHTGDHYGFNDAATKVCGYISDYIAEKEISGNIKIWITGYSRAGATATQAAAKLDRGEVDGISIDNTDVYAYGFATPMGAIKDSDPSNPIYDNIFSIINYHDIVPLVAPEKWGFDRYGKTYIFPYKTSSSESNSYEKRMKAYLKSMGVEYEVDNFVPAYAESNDSLGLFMRKFVDSFARNVGFLVPNAATGRIGYRLKYQKDFQAALGSGLLGGHSLELGLGLAALVSKNDLDSRYTALLLKQAGLNPRLTLTAELNYYLLAKAHADQRYYLAWMQSMDENYVSDAHCRFMTGNGRVIKIKCPVDVVVTDSEGNLVATIIDEKPWQDEEASVIASMDENGQKTVYLPIDAEYSITVTAREDCDVIYTVEETTASSLEPVRVTNYNIHDLSENEEIVAEVGKYPDEEIEQPATEASSAEYEVFKDGQALDPSLELNNPVAVESHTYTVTAEFNEDEGNVYGIGQYVEGSEVILTAESNPGYTFDGFYLDGNKLTDEDLDNDSSTVQLLITDNVKIQAKFTKNTATPEQLDDRPKDITGAEIYLEYTKTTYNGKYKKPWVSAEKDGYEYDDDYGDFSTTYKNNKNVGKATVTIKGINGYTGTAKATFTIVPKGTSISKIAKAKKGFTVKWKKQAAKMSVKRITGYQIRYSLKPNMKSAKTVKVKGYKAKSKKITKLKAKKKYYVQIRTYMKVGKKTYYSEWSKKKSVKTK